MSSPRALDVTLKVRASNGLKVNQYRGHGLPEDGNLRISCWPKDLCFGVELEHDGTKLEPGRLVLLFLFVCCFPFNRVAKPLTKIFVGLQGYGVCSSGRALHQPCRWHEAFEDSHSGHGREGQR